MLSPTHLHEFKSADQLNLQTPVMSLYLHEQKLGSHSQTDSSSHKFMLKGRQTGGMHRGHGWVFRAESRDTMLAWYNDIKSMNEKTGMERDAYVRKHARSISHGSTGARSGSSDGGMEEDEADQTPFSPVTSHVEDSISTKAPERPQPGGRFPSDLNVHRGLQGPLSPSSGTSSGSHDAIAAASALPDSDIPFGNSDQATKRQQAKTQDSSAAQTGHRGEQKMANSKAVTQEYFPVQELASSPPQVQEPTIQQGSSSLDHAEVLAVGAGSTSGSKSLPSKTALLENNSDHAGSLEGISSNVREGVPTSPITEIDPPVLIYAEATSPSTGLLRPEPKRTISEAPTQESIMTAMTESTTELPFSAKPPFISQNSTLTVSDLHIPGEFPRNAK